MLSYQHEYHCGNAADVLKHAVLALAIRALQKKDTPIRVIDGHAGSGRYDLRARASRQNAEFEDGVSRVLAAPSVPAELDPYLEAIRAANPDGPELRFYPGSPEIARLLLRPVDQLDLLELHPRAVAQLSRFYGRDPRIHIHGRNAFEGLPALVPPPERRGIVLIDPSYEVKDEFVEVPRLVAACHRRWPTGVYLAWYPLVRHPLSERFPAKVRGTGIPKLLHVELQTQREGFDGLRGSGLMIVNPPFGLAEQLGRLMPWLWETLRIERFGGWKVE